MKPFLPPDTVRILPVIARRNARRLSRLVLRLSPRTRAQREALRALRDARRSLRGRRRVAFLLRPDLRAWIAEGEEACFLARPPASDIALIDRLARGRYMEQVLPRGRIDAAARHRARALGRRLAARAMDRLPLILAFATPAKKRYGPFTLRAPADGETACASGEAHMPAPIPVTLRLTRPARFHLDDRGIVFHGRRVPGWVRRPVLEGSGILLARRVHATRRGLRPGAHAPGDGRRLARALALIGRAWPAAHAEVIAHTQVVVPLREEGTVSYSMITRPGVSYINPDGKSIVSLADDLLHETAHHRLHALEETGALDRDDGEARWISPWRGTPRPVRGILHGAYTFTWRAALFARLLGLPDRLARRWIARECARECAAVEEALASLEEARRLGLLTPKGVSICRAVSRRLREVRRVIEPRARRAGHADRQRTWSRGRR